MKAKYRTSNTEETLATLQGMKPELIKQLTLTFNKDQAKRDHSKSFHHFGDVGTEFIAF